MTSAITNPTVTTTVNKNYPSINFPRNEIDQTTISFARQVLIPVKETEKTPLILESARVKKEPKCTGDCIMDSIAGCLSTLCLLGACGGIIYFFVWISLPKPIMHPNECDQYNAINQQLVNGTGAFMESTFLSLIGNHNVTVPVQPIIDSFEKSFISVFTSSIYYRDCSQTSDIWDCGGLFQYLYSNLNHAVPLICQSVSLMASGENISIDQAEVRSSIVNKMCDIAIHNTGRLCPLSNLCDFIQH